MRLRNSVQQPRLRSRWVRFAAVVGPGIVVMLADTDAGSIITAAQSGAEWGYRLLLLQAVLIPVLYIVQELTVRLGIVTGKGHGQLIRHHFGSFWAWVSVSSLILACIGALITELSGIAGVGLLVGIPARISMFIVIAGLMLMVYTGSYRTVERIAIAIGLFELVFLIVAWQAHAQPAAILAGAFSLPLTNPKYLYLVAANIGAVIMPWMVFYQQSAVVEKKLKIEDLTSARLDTAIGSVITQLVMAAVLVATAATIGLAGRSQPLETVQQIAQAITPFLGERVGTLMFALGMIGAALVATIVVTLTAARTLGEVMGFRHSLEYLPREAPWFYGVYTVSLILGGFLVVSGISLVRLSIGVQVMNALLLPIVLGFLYLLARRALPDAHRLKGFYAAIVAIIIIVTAGFGVFAALTGIFI
ncbi:MAG: divalent metal cation transporter [Gammaproteobacteria bacterium]|nr:divalent metal cation transporter [Gammaproteobacteria bacterium]